MKSSKQSTLKNWLSGSRINSKSINYNEESDEESDEDRIDDEDDEDQTMTKFICPFENCESVQVKLNDRERNKCSEFRKHVSKNHQDQLIKCKKPGCGLTFNNKTLDLKLQAFIKHLNTCCKWTFNCDQCDRKFRTKANLTAHRDSQHLYPNEIEFCKYCHVKIKGCWRNNKFIRASQRVI